MKVLHLLASNVYSGAENVVCQIIDMFNGEVEMVYCSPEGKIRQALEEKNITFMPIDKLNKKELKRVVNEFKPDIIHSHDIRASIVASSFGKKIPVISHIHGNDKRNMGRLTPKSILYRLVSKRFKKVIHVSNSCFNDYIFKKSIENKSVVLHNIISIDRLYQKEKLDKNSYEYEVCYLGRLSEIKNPMRALEIMKNVIQKRPETKCVFIGDGELRNECESFVKDNKLEENITFLGFVNNPYKIVKSARVVLMSSINEGTPMALLESFALGIPLVSSKVDGAVELITNDSMGYLYDTNEEAVDEILKIINSDKKKYIDYLTKYSVEYNDINKYKEQILNAYK